MKLYRLQNGLGSYWVLANDPTEAEKKLNQVLNAGAGYGFSDKREVKEIHLIADEITKDGLTSSHPYTLTNKHLLLAEVSDVSEGAAVASEGQENN